VHQVPLFVNDVAAEFKEPAGNMRVSRHVERMRHIGRIARPHIGIRIESVLQHVGIGRGNNGAVFIYVRTHKHERSFKQRNVIGRKIVEIPRIRIYPHMPKISRLFDQFLGRLFLDKVLNLVGFVNRFCRRERVVNRARLPRRVRRVQSHHRIRRSVFDRILGEFAIVGVAV
jgi:hypothetical protein